MTCIGNMLKLVNMSRAPKRRLRCCTCNVICYVFFLTLILLLLPTTFLVMALLFFNFNGMLGRVQNIIGLPTCKLGSYSKFCYRLHSVPDDFLRPKFRVGHTEDDVIRILINKYTYINMYIIKKIIS